MDIFQAFLSHNDENPPTFSEIFHSAAALKRALGTKSYLLDHYLSLFFRLTAQIDFVALQDEVHQVMADTPFRKRVHRGKSGGTGGGLAPVDAANQILCFFNPFHPLS